MKFIKQAFGEFNKFPSEIFMSVRFCLSYDILNVIFSPSKFFISMKICIVVTDTVMMILDPPESDM